MSTLRRLGLFVGAALGFLPVKGGVSRYGEVRAASMSSAAAREGVDPNSELLAARFLIDGSFCFTCEHS